MSRTVLVPASLYFCCDRAGALPTDLRKILMGSAISGVCGIAAVTFVCLVDIKINGMS